LKGGGILNRKNFPALREIICRKIQLSGRKYSYHIGKERKRRVSVALKELKKEGKIRDFLPAGNLSFSDVVRGIDFYAVCINGVKYRTYPFSVTGKYWAERDRKHHPEIPVIAVDLLGDTLGLIKEKIMEAINHR